MCARALTLMKFIKTGKILRWISVIILTYFYLFE